MQTIYKTESSFQLRWLLLIAGMVLLALCVADFLAPWPDLGDNQFMDLSLLFSGSILGLIGLKEVTGFVREIAVEDGRRLIVSKALGTSIVPGDAIQSLTIYTGHGDQRRLVLATKDKSYEFASRLFAADRIAETIKAINPATVIDRQA